MVSISGSFIDVEHVSLEEMYRSVVGPCSAERLVDRK